MKKTFAFWFIALLFTLLIAYYQRTTGPTVKIRTTIDVYGEAVKLKLHRSHGGDENAKVKVTVANEEVSGSVFYRKHQTGSDAEAMQEVQMTREGDTLVCQLPHQPPAGKLAYYLQLSKEGQEPIIFSAESPIIIRFKGGVPAAVLIPHIIAMFTSLLFTVLAGIMAIFKDQRFFKYTFLALILLFVGGLILGPVVQLYAFDELWAGVPFGWDLTDNKTLLAFIALLAAVLVSRKERKPIATLVAVVITLTIFLIPHSMFGSELDHSTGTIKQAATVSTPLHRRS